MPIALGFTAAAPSAAPSAAAPTAAAPTAAAPTAAAPSAAAAAAAAEHSLCAVLLSVQTLLYHALFPCLQLLVPDAEQWRLRGQKVSEHIAILQQHLNCPASLHLTPFGSSLSHLCLANSDVDLGVFGRYGNRMQLLEDLPHKQQQSLLHQVLRAIQDAKLARHKVGHHACRQPAVTYNFTETPQQRCINSTLCCLVRVSLRPPSPDSTFAWAFSTYCWSAS
jgi:hypothetical protein